jgi:hypothetical protein
MRRTKTAERSESIAPIGIGSELSEWGLNRSEAAGGDADVVYMW